MIITYLRSSSFNTHEWCPMKYFLEYVLGWPSPPNKKAEKGTIVHKVLEILAKVKLHIQSGNTNKTITDSIVGRVSVKQTMNLSALPGIIKKVFTYYSNKSNNDFHSMDLEDCNKWVYKAIEYHGGEYNPLYCEIITAEQSFDFCIEKPWAMYHYDLTGHGTICEGFLGLKGTIDQISRIDNDTLMILDWKTGRRWDWAKDAEKDYQKLCSDPQLMMYYYAANYLYPNIPHIVITIYFINDGGPYSLCFSKEDIPRIERMLQQKFEDIMHTEIPRRCRSWKCNKFCHYGMNNFSTTHVQPIIERRTGQICQPGEIMTMCEQTAYCLEHRSIDAIMKHMSSPQHNIDTYIAPGT